LDIPLRVPKRYTSPLLHAQRVSKNICSHCPEWLDKRVRYWAFLYIKNDQEANFQIFRPLLPVSHFSSPIWSCGSQY
jgi:hypothetical protein